MDDSFSLLAKSIRQQKINKDELLNNLKQISGAQFKRDKYIKNIIKIQKIIRGHLYRIKYHLTLEEINTKTIIDYLHEKKKKRIHSHSKEIISFFISKYIIKMRKNKKKNMLLEQYKIHCSNLIKARFKGILVRKLVKEELYLIKKAKEKIFKHILAYRTILILKSNNMQNLLKDIAIIKSELMNLNEEKDLIKIKELNNKLSKNINLFHDTYYYTKENCNWVIEKKTSEKWNKKFFDIINKKTKEKCTNNNKKGFNSSSNGYANYLLEYYYNDSDDNDIDNGEINPNFLTSHKKPQKPIYSSTLNITYKKNKGNEYFENIYETSKKVSEFKIDKIKNEGETNRYKNKKFKKYENIPSNKNNINYSEREKKNLISENKRKKEMNSIDLNNINSYNNKYKKEKEELLVQSSINIYQQREERPIKPLKINNILNCENPFGLRENNFKKTNIIKQENNLRKSMQNLNQFNNQYNYQKKNSMVIRSGYGNRDMKDKKQINELKEEYGYHRINSGKENDYKNFNFLNRDEKPIGGGRKIDYVAMFGEGGEINFEGDPFGGVKQFETNKNKIHHHKSNSVAVRKKPIYDARKAIEQAKLKEAKEGKIEKHSEFRDFLKEMKKLTAEEKLKKKNINNGKKENEIIDIKKSFSESINKNGNEIINGNNVYKNNYIIDENKNFENSKKKEYVKNEKNSNKSTSSKMLRKKLHEIEKAPAVLNIKGVKSRIECWFDNNSNNNGNKYLEYTEKLNGQNKMKKLIHKEYDENNNIISTKKMENKIENYVDKKFSQLNLQIDKINDIFSIENYFEQKENKMKKFINIPYISESNFYATNFSNEIYDDLINDIYKEYKNLK